jgi:hypothetical protein
LSLGLGLTDSIPIPSGARELFRFVLSPLSSSPQIIGPMDLHCSLERSFFSRLLKHLQYSSSVRCGWMYYWPAGGYAGSHSPSDGVLQVLLESSEFLTNSVLKANFFHLSTSLYNSPQICSNHLFANHNALYYSCLCIPQNTVS